MRLRTLFAAAAIASASAACATTAQPAPIVAHASDAPVIVRVEFGRIWWARCAWAEPHELWKLPGTGAVENLTVTRQGNGFVVSFRQSGSFWQGSFGSGPKTNGTLSSR